MGRRAYKTSIPNDAEEVIEERHPGGAKKSASYFAGGEQVGYRSWDENGQLEYESSMRCGVRHGATYSFHPNGQVLEKEPYRHGLLHGTGRQWSEDGRLLVTWKLARGTGLDLWCDTQHETLAEEHYWPREGELGYSRDWNKDERTVWREYYYAPGTGYHGIWREWNGRGRLRRDFPRYYVNERRVTRRQYAKACEADSLLPAYRAEDDDPHRELPAAYRVQRREK